VHNLGFVLERQGRYGEAQALYERALAIFETVLGAQHPNTQGTRENLAALRAVITADDQQQ